MNNSNNNNDNKADCRPVELSDKKKAKNPAHICIVIIQRSSLANHENMPASDVNVWKLLLTYLCLPQAMGLTFCQKK
jgi:hypothetical protein